MPIATPPWLHDVSAIFASYGVPAHTWLGIIGVEDPSYNIYATNPNSGAMGLFQIMPMHGVGFDPVAQAQWAAPRMAAAISATGSTDPVTVAINSDWPGNISYLPQGANDPEVQAWIHNYNRDVLPALADASSSINQFILAIGDGGGTPPNSITVPLPGQPASEAPPPANGGSTLGFPNIVELPEVQIADTPFGKIGINPTGLVNIGGRMALSVVALGVIMMGAVWVLWQSTPDSVKDGAVKAVAA